MWHSIKYWISIPGMPEISNEGRALHGIHSETLTLLQLSFRFYLLFLTMVFYANGRLFQVSRAFCSTKFGPNDNFSTASLDTHSTLFAAGGIIAPVWHLAVHSWKRQQFFTPMMSANIPTNISTFTLITKSTTNALIITLPKLQRRTELLRFTWPCWPGIVVLVQWCAWEALSFWQLHFYIIKLTQHSNLYCTVLVQSLACSTYTRGPNSLQNRTLFVRIRYENEKQESCNAKKLCDIDSQDY